MTLYGSALPDFPWDSLIPFRDMAEQGPSPLVDLSVGTPVDPTAPIAQEALVQAADSPGYPAAAGTEALRAAVASWFARRRAVPGVGTDEVLPTIGSKEIVALLPALLGIGAGDVVAHPDIAYPTYDVGARLAGARPLPVDVAALAAGTLALDPTGIRLLWLNSPSNPTGRVLSVEELAAIVRWARAHGVVVAADECYAELAWTEPWRSAGVPSLLDPRVCDGSFDGLLVAYSLSKQSNLAGYRAAFLAGDRRLIARLTEIRRHAGFIVPGPVQAAMTCALGDDEHVRVQWERYDRRRTLLASALTAAGMAVGASEAGLYLWVTDARFDDVPTAGRAAASGGAGQGRERCWSLVAAFARAGILVAPGSFYGAGGAEHVRIALTATDDLIDAAAQRIEQM